MTAFWDQVRDLFQSAAERPPDERRELLARADTPVRNEVESLLAAHDEQTPFLDQSVWQLIDAQQGERLAGTLIGPYRVTRQLGHGGMGTVFLAERESGEFSQVVAIKLVRGGEMLVQRFRQERQILASLEHPNVARLIDGGTTTDGLPYLVMEYVEGTPIDDFARALPIAEKLRLFLQLCDAVQYAHRSLVIHRDLKPANVLVTAEGVVKLLDFGIAKLQLETPRADATATRLMTPQYASPEQLLGRAVTTASDVYSLGVILFELLTGSRPFDSDTRTAETEPARPSTRSGLRSLRGDLDTIILAALEPDPARRYGSAEKLGDDVRRHLSGHPVAARPATFAYRATKFVRRNKLAVAAAMVIAIVTAIAFAATLHQKRIAERRFDEVRSLASAVVFELHDAIAPLPGSTPARELLVRRALVYLDRLGEESADNTALRMELAGAYLKIGDVQGLPYAPNLGDTAGAMASYGKALNMVHAVYEEDPEDLAARSLLADAHDRVGFIEQRALHWASALGRHEAARAIRQDLPHEASRDIALARTWTAIGDCRYIGHSTIPKEALLGTPRQAYESALAILAKVPRGSRDGDLLREKGRAHQRLGGYHTGGMERDIPRALRHHDAALRVLEERARLDPGDAVARRNWADQFIMKATAHNMMHDGGGALESTGRGLELLTPLAAADPKNVEAQHDLAFAYSEQGRAYASLQRFDEAVRAFEQAAAIHERLLADDPSNAEDRRDLKRVRGMLEEARKGRAR
jgi:non-specific serine/threonine protein kinase/serine/threonine-protein kinase